MNWLSLAKICPNSYFKNDSSSLQFHYLSSSKLEHGGKGEYPRLLTTGKKVDKLNWPLHLQLQLGGRSCAGQHGINIVQANLFGILLKLVKIYIKSELISSILTFGVFFFLFRGILFCLQAFLCSIYKVIMKIRPLLQGY